MDETWKSMESAPLGGRWFLVLRAVTIIGVGQPARAAPELMILRRSRSSPESGGYWQNTWAHSVADQHVSGSLWAELDALPLREMWERIEQERLRQGGEPMPLPVPLEPA